MTYPHLAVVDYRSDGDILRCAGFLYHEDDDCLLLSSQLRRDGRPVGQGFLVRKADVVSVIYPEVNRWAIQSYDA